MRKLTEYEIKFERFNIFTRTHEIEYDFFFATSEQEAKSKLTWKYGQQVDILSVKVFS